LAVVLLIAGCGKSPPAGLPRDQAAVVNGVSISVDKLNAVAKADEAAAAGQQQQSAPPPTGAELNRQALGELVQSEIVLQAAKQQGINVSDADVAAP